MADPFKDGLERREANFQPLTPLVFLARAADVMPDHTAIIHGSSAWTYAMFYRRSRRLASAIAERDIGRGDAVSVLLPNVPAMLEAHHGVPMSGAVLHAINTRLDAAAIAFQLDHCKSRMLIVDRALLSLAEAALELCEVTPALVSYDDPEWISASDADRLVQPVQPVLSADRWQDYEDMISHGDPNFQWLMPQDEWDAIAISYTSGTTGDPKGVVTHHRGAYLLAQGNALIATMPRHATYLWTLPMFHCNGWCFPWTLSVLFGTHVCLREVRAEPIWQALAEHDVTHLCGAPPVMALLVSTPGAERKALARTVEFFTAAAPPPRPTLAGMEQAGFNVTQLYGLTETYGPAVVNEWHKEWDSLHLDDRTVLKARQGVRYLPLESLAVLDPETLDPVPHDGETLGEVMFRGNVVMKGYFRNPEATEAAFAGGWFHSGDLGVVHPDGYVELKDRSKDIIISGGENISSIEVEDALHRHPAIAGVAVVAMPHDRWGETPCAFVEVAPDAAVTEEELRQHCRDNLAAYKVPRYFVFDSIPRTSTGKIQKHLLRSRISD